MWDNYATPVATPYRNEPIIHSVSLSVTMTRPSPPRADGRTPRSAQQCGSVISTNRLFMLSTNRLFMQSTFGILHDHEWAPGSDRRELPQTWIPLGAVKPGEFIQILTRCRCSQPAMARNLTCPVSHSVLTPVAENGHHNWHGSSSTTPVHCENDMMPRYAVNQPGF